MNVALGELLDSGVGQVEFVPTSAEGVPAEVPVPTPVEIGAVVFFEGDATGVRGIAAAGDF